MDGEGSPLRGDAHFELATSRSPGGAAGFFGRHSGRRWAERSTGLRMRGVAAAGACSCVSVRGPLRAPGLGIRDAGPFAAISLGSGSPAQARDAPGAAAEARPQRILTGDGKQLIWDGCAFHAVDESRAALQSLPLHQRLAASAEQCQAALRRAFLPDKSSVTDDYWPYARWRATQRVFTSMLGVLATQSMLEAVGVGAKRSLPVAATLNWVLKDGLGKLGKISVAAVFGRGFDADLKACRFRSSCLYEACIFLELLTPYFPQHFLALATTAKVGLSMAYTTHAATQPAFNKSFAKGEHMAEISAKNQAQQTAAETLGLALVVIMRTAIRNNAKLNRALPLIMFPICAFGDIFSISHELKAVELKTVNMQRGEIIARHWVMDREAPTPGQVSKAEMIFIPSLEAKLSGQGLPLDLTPVVNLASSPRELENLLLIYKGEKFLLNVRPVEEGRSPGEVPSGAFAVSLRAAAAPEDLLLLVLQAAHLRRLCADVIAPLSPIASGTMATNDMLRRSLAAARKDLRPFMKDMQRQGWIISDFMISTDDKEKCTFQPVK